MEKVGGENPRKTKAMGMGEKKKGEGIRKKQRGGVESTGYNINTGRGMENRRVLGANAFQSGREKEKVLEQTGKKATSPRGRGCFERHS